MTVRETGNALLHSRARLAGTAEQVSAPGVPSGIRLRTANTLIRRHATPVKRVGRFDSLCLDVIFLIHFDG